MRPIHDAEVTIPLEHYEALTISRAQLITIKRAYEQLESYQVDHVLRALFGKEKEDA